MQHKTWKKQKRKGMRFAAAVLAAVLTVAAPFEDMPGVAFGAQRETQQALPTGGLMELRIETVDSISPGKTGGTSMLRSIRPELRQYDWDCYSSDYYYSKLTAEEQRFYERLDAVCGELLTSPGVDAEIHSVTGTNITRGGTKSVSVGSLNQEQTKRVAAIFIYSNPQYYFLTTVMYLNSARNACSLGIYDAFVKAGDRQKATQKVQTRLEELQAQVSDNGFTYETEAQIHDLLCDELTYMAGDDLLNDVTDPYYTQTVYGALVNGETLCAGYAKLYTMLCNYFGIDCIPVMSATHAWNQVRYGDHWYIVDVTWDDARDRGKYFHLSDEQLVAIDRTNEHVPSSICDAIRPVADVAFSGDMMLMPGLAQPEVQIEDTAAGITITMTSGEGEIFYTLDGTAPGADDLYTEPIQLTDRGVYIVTAMTAGEGKISSAYEIFPVRIAGGSVSVSSATNLSGKKIRVRLKASTSYAGYEVSYALKKDFSKQKTALLDCSSMKRMMVDISGLRKGKTYYIRVRGYKKDAYGNYYYTPYSKIKKVTVTK